MSTFTNDEGKSILLAVVKAIQDSKDELGRIDSEVGDGDHGINMNLGFTRFSEKYADEEYSFSDGLNNLGTLLEDEIGGSMGPLYGTLFEEMGDAGDGEDEIDLDKFAEMVNAGLEGLLDITEARVGDKTLVDTLTPAAESLKNDAEAGTDFADALENMKTAAMKGCESTKELPAKFGRGQYHRGQGVGSYDAGSCSCCIILTSMANAIKEQLH